MTLNTASAIYSGSNTASKVYMGSTLVWSSAPPAGPTVQYLFDGGTGTFVPSTGEWASGSPQYEDSTVFGAAHDTGLRLLQTDYVELDTPALVNSAFSGDIYTKQDFAIASGRTDAVAIENSSGDVISGIRFNSNGNVQTLRDSSYHSNATSWSAGDTFKIGWQYDESINECLWSFQKNGGTKFYKNVTGITNTTPSDIRLNRSGSPTGTSALFDTVRMWSGLHDAGDY